MIVWNYSFYSHYLFDNVIYKWIIIYDIDNDGDNDSDNDNDSVYQFVF